MSGRGIATLIALAGLLAVAGAGVAAYLTVVHYAHQPIACSSIGDCELVNSSRYASIGSVPVAVLGLCAYVTMAALIVGSWLRRDATFLAAALVIALASFAFSMYLTYVEIAVLDAICVYCVASATIVSALCIVLAIAVWRARGELFALPADGHAADREAAM